MAKKKSASTAAPEAAASASEVPEGHLRIYPTHRLSSGPLRIALPAVEGESDELVITDEGADVPEAVAQHVINSRDASLEPPESGE